MEDENLYDEFGNYIGPEIDEKVSGVKKRKKKCF